LGHDSSHPLLQQKHLIWKPVLSEPTRTFDQILGRFKRRGNTRGGELLLIPGDALRVVALCEAGDLAVISAEGMSVDDDHTVPLPDLIADCSSPSAVTWREYRSAANACSRSFLESLTGAALSFHQPYGHRSRRLVPWLGRQGCATLTRVARIDEKGGPAFVFAVAASEPAAGTERRVPVEGAAKDSDGVLIHFLVHVVAGHLPELEIYREDCGATATGAESGDSRFLEACCRS
jgi:hypothetical protein